MYFVYNDNGVIAINLVYDQGGVHATGFEELHAGQTWKGHTFADLKDGRYDLDGKYIGVLTSTEE